jgi:hypothetical protein
MLNAKQLTLEDWDKFDRYISKTNSLVYDACFPLLYSFLNYNKKKTFWWKGKLIAYRQGLLNDVRVLYRADAIDAKLLQELESMEEIDHVGYAFMSNFPKGKIHVKNNEMVQDVDAISAMQGHPLKPIRKDYNSFEKARGFETIPARAKDLNKVLAFFELWKVEMSKEFGFPVNCEKDVNLAKFFLSKRGVNGTIVLQKNNVVGIELNTYHPSNKKEQAISLMKKNLRVHRGLGTYLKVIQAKKLADNGVRFVNVAQANREREFVFKKKFMVGNSYTQNMYYYTSKFKPSAKRKICINLLDKIWW